MARRIAALAAGLIAAAAAVGGGAARAADVPGNARTRASLTIDTTLEGRAEAAGDVDWYRVELTAGKNYAFRLLFHQAATASRGAVTLRDSKGRLLGGSDSVTTADGEFHVGGFEHRAGASGAYFLEVRAESRGGYATGFGTDTPATLPTKAVLALGVPATNDFDYDGDRDTYAVQLVQGHAYAIDVVGPSDDRRGWRFLDTSGRTLADSRSREPAQDPTGTAPTPVDQVRAPYTGTFYVQADNVTDERRRGGYTITVGEVADAPPWGPGAAPSADDDLLRLTEGPDVADGLEGNDLVYGLGGDDRLAGGPGSDALAGGGGNDVLDGGPGDDLLIGGDGDDRLIGGAGGGLDKAWGDAGRDVFDASVRVIHDFVPGEDRIDLGALDADATRAGRQPFRFVGGRAPSRAGEVGYVKDPFGDSTELVGLARVGGEEGVAATLRIRLDGRRDLHAADLIL